MDVSPDHEPTLIERGTDVHLNHSLAAQRGIHDSQPARWESWTPHPSALRKGGEGVHKTSSRAHLDRLEWARARGLDARLHLLDMHRTQVNADTCVWHRRGWLKQTPRTLATHCGKTLLECTHSTKSSGGYTRGCASAPPQNGTTTRREERPIRSTNLCRFLTETAAKAWGLLSETAIRVP
jgi:hypothetical protein